MIILTEHENLKYKFGNRNFSVTGYYVGVVERNVATIQKYIREQDQSKYKINTKEQKNSFEGSRLLYHWRLNEVKASVIDMPAILYVLIGLEPAASFRRGYDFNIVF